MLSSWIRRQWYGELYFVLQLFTFDKYGHMITTGKTFYNCFKKQVESN